MCVYNMYVCMYIYKCRVDYTFTCVLEYDVNLVLAKYTNDINTVEPV